ncbi:hypothetical protein PYCC9005_002982 [Savitreella phatthalungensis]
MDDRRLMSASGNTSTASVPAQGALQYVFVDESERNSKRIKISRACDSCKKRKVRCDVIHMAPGEPCTSCRRLRVECILPQIQGAEEIDLPRVARERLSEQDSSARSHDHAQQLHQKQQAPQPPALEQLRKQSQSSSATSESQGESGLISNTTDPMHPRQMRQVHAQQPWRPGNNRPTGAVPSSKSKPSKSAYLNFIPTMAAYDPPKPQRDTVSVDSLSSVFDKMHIQVSGRSEIFADQPRTVTSPMEAARIPEQIITRAIPDIQLPLGLFDLPVTVSELQEYMPPEDLAMQLIDIYFDKIHLYVPIIDKASFLHEFLNDRDKLSPYLLFAVFGLAARFSDDPRVYTVSSDPETRGDLWWNLVPRLRYQFTEAPRLSTLQAETLLIKNLETRPSSRGFFYRGWHQLGMAVRMGRDLGFHRLLDVRLLDKEIILGKRIWQTLFIFDHTMGAGQGRERTVGIDTVDLTLVPAEAVSHYMNAEQCDIHNNFVYMVGAYKIMRQVTDTYQTQGIAFPFSAMPIWPTLEDAQMQWRFRLPERLRFDCFTASALPSHFHAHLHLAHALHVLVVHRAWVVSQGEYGATGEWRHHLRICLEESKEITILLEMLHRQYGDDSFFYQVRGNIQAIYAAIVSSMLLAVCTTCPEPEFSEGTSDFLDRCLNMLLILTAKSGTPAMAQQAAVLKHILGSQTSIRSHEFTAPKLTPAFETLQKQYNEMRESREQFISASPAPAMFPTGQQQYEAHQADDYSFSESFVTPPIGSTLTPDSGHQQQFQHHTTAHDINPQHQNDETPDYYQTADLQFEAIDDFAPYDGPALAGWDPSPLMGAWAQSFPQIRAPPPKINTADALAAQRMAAQQQHLQPNQPQRVQFPSANLQQQQQYAYHMAAFRTLQPHDMQQGNGGQVHPASQSPEQVLAALSPQQQASLRNASSASPPGSGPYVVAGSNEAPSPRSGRHPSLPGSSPRYASP